MRVRMLKFIIVSRESFIGINKSCRKIGSESVLGQGTLTEGKGLLLLTSLLR
jgi:hypothetical protein